MTGKDLLLFTTSFPYGTVTEASFVMAELPHLCRQFRRVIIIPEISKGTPIDLSDYKNVTVDTSRVDSIDHRKPLTKLRFAIHPSVIPQGLRSLPHAPIAKWPAAWSMAINRYRISKNLKSIIQRHNIDCSNAVFYTFWFDHVTEAIAMALPHDCGALVAGAHGHDYMYSDTPTFRIKPFREFALGRMSRLYVASHEGMKMLQKEHSSHADKICTRILGSSKIHTGEISPNTKNSEPEPEITFLSCARMVPYKRVDLAISFISSLAKSFPSVKFRYIHIGDGPLGSSIRGQIARIQPSNVTFDIKGFITNKEVQDIYRNTSIDWTILLSTMEGGNPIALSEALSYGVPVIACNVPGCCEIADDTVGILLSPNPTAEEFIRRISPYIRGEKSATTLRRNALKRWEEHFDASKLRAKFATELAQLPTRMLITR